MGDLALVFVDLEGAQNNAPTKMVAKFSPIKTNTPTFIIKNVFGTEAHWYNDFLEEDQGFGRPEAYFIAAKLVHVRPWKRLPVFCMLFEAMPPAPYSRTSGCGNLDHLKAVMSVLGSFHAKWWNHPKQYPLNFLNHPTDYNSIGKNLVIAGAKLGLPALKQCFGDVYAPVLEWTPLIRKHLKWFVDQVFTPPFTVCHGDVHLDNIFFNDEWPTGIKMIDFGNIQFGQGMFDVAYFMGTNIEPDLRRAHQDELMQGYHAELVRGGVKGYSLDDCWRDYKLNLFRVLINIMFVTWTDFRKPHKNKTGIFAAEPTPKDAKLRATYDAVNRRCAASLVDAKFDELLKSATPTCSVCCCCICCA
uniref:CHK kinase-like domain-containing protein n=1 Tax=Chrysotila carterae TaxID=13221 RepID=A0A7S4F895_CHRCT